LIFLCRHVLGNGNKKKNQKASHSNRIPRQDKLPFDSLPRKTWRKYFVPCLILVSVVAGSLLYGQRIRLKWKRYSSDSRDLRLRRRSSYSQRFKARSTQDHNAFHFPLDHHPSQHLLTVRTGSSAQTLEAGWGRRANLPDVLRLTRDGFQPGWEWQWLFPQHRRMINQLTGDRVRQSSQIQPLFKKP